MGLHRTQDGQPPAVPPPQGAVPLIQPAIVATSRAVRDARDAAAAAAVLVHEQILGRIDPALAVRMSITDLKARVAQLVIELADERRLLLNQQEQEQIAQDIVDDMVGHGPLEPLLQDQTVSDILVNGAHQVFIERRGKLVLTDVHFRDDAHVLRLAQRIASQVGRRVDQSSPMLDARLADGSRVNVVIPPLSLKGPCISIRKFSRTFIDFAQMISLKSASPELARALEIAARCRLNILISGGTGSGKTTLLNALSGLIDQGERIVTIEDTAELKLQQHHVVQLESRPQNVEGEGAISQRDLLRNALRMRPDRIIVGEVRGAEAFDMMQAMNTGHDGSMTTTHANSARDAFARVETMVMMVSQNVPDVVIRHMLASAIQIVVHCARLSDGTRKLTGISEVTGVEGDEVVMREIFVLERKGLDGRGRVQGRFAATGVLPHFLQRIRAHGIRLADSIFSEAQELRER